LSTIFIFYTKFTKEIDTKMLLLMINLNEIFLMDVNKNAGYHIIL
jgi:hypothetical protein